MAGKRSENRSDAPRAVVTYIRVLVHACIVVKWPRCNEKIEKEGRKVGEGRGSMQRERESKRRRREKSRVGEGRMSMVLTGL